MSDSRHRYAQEKTRSQEYKEDRRVSKMQQDDALRAKQITKLRELAASATRNGAMPGALPQIHDRMSMADIAKAFRDLAKYDKPAKSETKAPESKPATPPTAPAAKTTQAPPPAPAKQPAAASPTRAVVASQPKTAPGIVGKVSTQAAGLGPALTGMTAPGVAGAVATAAAVPGAKPVVAQPPATPPSAEPPPTAPAAPAAQPPQPAVFSNPLEQLADPMHAAMVRSGTLAPGHKLMKTGAGYVTPALNADGSQMTNPDGTMRFVSIQPTFDETMDAKTGGAYRGWTPEQRAQYFRMHPASTAGTSSEGTVTKVELPGKAMPVLGADPKNHDPATLHAFDAAGVKANQDFYSDTADRSGGGVSTSPAETARIAAKYATPALDKMVASKAPASGRSGSSESLMNLPQPNIPSGPGTNLVGPASSTGTANQVAPKPNSPQPSTGAAPPTLNDFQGPGPSGLPVGMEAQARQQNAASAAAAAAAVTEQRRAARAASIASEQAKQAAQIATEDEQRRAWAAAAQSGDFQGF